MSIKLGICVECSSFSWLLLVCARFQSVFFLWGCSDLFGSGCVSGFYVRTAPSAGPPPPGPPNISLFISLLPPQISFCLLSLSLREFQWNCGPQFKAMDHPKCTGFLGVILCGPGGCRPPECHTKTTFPREDPQREKKKRNLAGKEGNFGRSSGGVQ